MLTLKTPLEKGSKKLINAWAFYDWANSVYSLVISSAIFPIYFGALFSEINTIYGRYFNEDTAPARETVEVANLPKYVNVEISMIAVK